MAVLPGSKETDSPVVGSSGSGNSQTQVQANQVDRIKTLYPNVKEAETPLPRCWSPTSRCLRVVLSPDNLRAHYTPTLPHPSAVRTHDAIPKTSRLYYFEMKILLKEGNNVNIEIPVIAIGISSSIFRLNRCPGWDTQSYGYHSDDGMSHSSGVSHEYGPTYGIGDIVGCGVNFVNNTCFFTKNGVDLGVASTDLSANSPYFPTLALATSGIEIEMNFGQQPFQYHQIEDQIKQIQLTHENGH